MYGDIFTGYLMKHCHNLTALELSNGFWQLSHLKRWFPSNKSLTHIRLKDCCSTSSSVNELIELIHTNCAQLTHLFIIHKCLVSMSSQPKVTHKQAVDTMIWKCAELQEVVVQCGEIVLVKYNKAEYCIAET